MILEDGLLSTGASISGAGVSSFTSQHDVIPDFYRLYDGVIGTGNPADLVKFAASLPGMKSEWEDLKEPERILRGLFDRGTTLESTIHRDLGAACERLRNKMELGKSILY